MAALGNGRAKQGPRGPGPRGWGSIIVGQAYSPQPQADPASKPHAGSQPQTGSTSQQPLEWPWPLNSLRKNPPNL